MSGKKPNETTPRATFAELSGPLYLLAVGMLYGLWRLWHGKEPIGMNELGDLQ